MRPEVCPNCGSLEFSQQPVAIQVQQVAQLVERPIEVVEYQRHSCECNRCGQTHTLLMAPNHRPWSRLGSEFTSPTRARWATTDICLTSKLQELMRELGDIDIGVGTLQATNARMAMVVEDSTLAVTGVGKAAILLYM